MSLFSYQEAYVIDQVSLRKSIFSESKFPGALNCLLLYLSISFLKGNTSTSPQGFDTAMD